MPHTPGPWKQDDILATDMYELSIRIRDADGNRIADVVSDGNDSFFEGNARLIAAAPALLALLREAKGDICQRAMPDKEWLKKTQKLLASLAGPEPA